MKTKYTKEQLEQIINIQKQFCRLDDEMGGNELELITSENLLQNKSNKESKKKERKVRKK